MSSAACTTPGGAWAERLGVIPHNRCCANRSETDVRVVAVDQAHEAAAEQGGGAGVVSLDVEHDLRCQQSRTDLVAS